MLQHLLLEISGGLKAHFKCFLSWYFIALPQEKKSTRIVPSPTQLPGGKSHLEAHILREMSWKLDSLALCAREVISFSPYLWEAPRQSTMHSSSSEDNGEHKCCIYPLVARKSAMYHLWKVGSRRPHRVRHILFQFQKKKPDLTVYSQELILPRPRRTSEWSCLSI